MTTIKFNKFWKILWYELRPYLVAIVSHFIIFSLSVMMLSISLVLTKILIDKLVVKMDPGFWIIIESSVIISYSVIIIVRKFYSRTKKRNEDLFKILEREKELFQEIESKTINELKRNDARSRY